MKGELIVASDLDGTLLTSDGRLTARTLAAIEAVVENGAHFVIATARPLRDVRALADRYDLRCLAICGNGSICYDLAQDAIVAAWTIPRQSAISLVAWLRMIYPDARFGADLLDGLILEDAFALHPAKAEGARRVVRFAGPRCGEAVGKLLLQLDGNALDYYASMSALGYTVTASGPEFCEITGAGVTKAAALASLAARLGLGAADVVAFGDMVNDLGMLAWAGTGIAMANAHPAVLAAADAVTDSNDADGVARYLETMNVVHSAARRLS